MHEAQKQGVRDMLTEFSIDIKRKTFRGRGTGAWLALAGLVGFYLSEGLLIEVIGNLFR